MINVSHAEHVKEYNKLKKEIDEDPRTTKDLFVDRYGAVSISEFFQINLDEIKEKVGKDNITLIEVYNPEYAECLLKSIPIKEITKDLSKDTMFYKTESDKELEEYNVKELPSLLVFKKGKLLGKIDGYYTVDDKEEFLSKIKEIVNNR